MPATSVRILVLGDPARPLAGLLRRLEPLLPIRTVPAADLRAPAALRRAVAAAPRLWLVLDLRRRGRARRLVELGAMTPAGTRVAVRGRGGWSVTRSAGTGRVKLSEADLTAVLVAAPALGEVVATRPAVSRPARCVIRSSDPARAAAPPAAVSAGAVTLRRFERVTCMPGQIAYTDGFLLPSTFRKAGHRPLHTSTLQDVSRSAARLPPAVGEPAELAGSYLYLDNVARPHFGHAMTEQLSQLWAWSRLTREEPGVRLLIGNRVGARGRLQEWERSLYAAAGVPPDRVVVVDRPVVVERLYTASPMYRLPDEVHPDIAGLWRQVGDALAALAPVAPRPDRVFWTRRGGNRVCRNVEAVEALFADHGFAVMRPEELTLPDQVAHVRAADVVAGLSGSGMFGIALAGRPQHVITVGPASYTAPNELRMAAVVGHRLDLALCRADVPRGAVFDRRSFQSAYRYDVDGPEHAFVSRVLRDL